MKFRNSLLYLFVIVLASCNTDPDEIEDDVTLYAEQLTYLNQDIISPALTEASMRASELNEAISVFAIDVNANTLASAQTALKTAWKSFQSLSPLRFGPGEDLIPSINTFPTNDNALQEFVDSGVYENPSDDEQGFPALDWLLNEQELTDEEIIALFSDATTGESRRNILVECSAKILAVTTAIETGWINGYASTFVNAAGASAGSGMSLYVNNLVQNYETLKRNKIALPLGLLTLDIPLPDKVEVFHGGYSIEMALVHLAAVKRGFVGEEGRGIKALLDELGAFHDASQMNLSDAILTQLEEAEVALALVPDPLSSTIESDPAIVQAAYDELQAAVVLLKADLPSALGISITFTDNDGD